MNRDSGIDILEAWMPTIKKQQQLQKIRMTANRRGNNTPSTLNSEDRNPPIRASENQPVTAEHSA